MDRATTLYRFYDAEDRLLYVGVTSVGPARWAQHEEHKDWWGLATRSTTEHYPTRAEAMNAERTAIKAEKPAHNITHTKVRDAKRPPVIRGHGRGTVFHRGDHDRWAVSAPSPNRTAYYFRDERAARAFLEVLILADDPDMKRALERLSRRSA